MAQPTPKPWTIDMLTTNGTPDSPAASPLIVPQHPISPAAVQEHENAVQQLTAEIERITGVDRRIARRAAAAAYLAILTSE